MAQVQSRKAEFEALNGEVIVVSFGNVVSRSCVPVFTKSLNFVGNPWNEFLRVQWEFIANSLVPVNI